MREQLDDIHFQGEHNAAPSGASLPAKIAVAFMALQRIQYAAPWDKPRRKPCPSPIACS